MSDGFTFHGFQRGPQIYATRHTILLLLALNDIWKQEKAKYQFTGGFDPARHFHKPTLLADLARAIAPVIKKVLTPGDVYAHLLYLSERKLGSDTVMVRNHPGNEKAGEPIFQMGKAGEELCDIIDNRGVRAFIESDPTNWHALVMYARLVESGQCSPSVWTPENIGSLTGLTESQIRKAIKTLQQGFTSKAGDQEFTLAAGSLVVEGTRRFPKYKLAASLRVSASPEIGDLDFEEDPKALRQKAQTATFQQIYGGKGPQGNGRAAAAADAFMEEFTKPEADPEPTPSVPASRPIGAKANISDQEVAILQAEAIRLRISLDSLMTLIIKTGIEGIERENVNRETAEAKRREAEEALRKEEEEAQRAAQAAAERLAEIQRRRAALGSETGASPAP